MRSSLNAKPKLGLNGADVFSLQLGVSELSSERILTIGISYIIRQVTSASAADGN